MKISPRASALALTATALLVISACGGSDAPANSEVKTPKTKNAALSFTTLPATTLAPSGVTAPPTTRPGKKNITITSAKPPT